MGYERSLHLIDIKIKQESIPIVNHALKSDDNPELTPIRFFLNHIMIDSAGFLCFKASEDGHDPYVPDDEGTVPALFGKWYKDEEIANWLKQHSESKGRIILHSIEADGEAWGWEFDGKGKMRALQLQNIGEWE